MSDTTEKAPGTPTKSTTAPPDTLSPPNTSPSKSEKGKGKEVDEDKDEKEEEGEDKEQEELPFQTLTSRHLDDIRRLYTVQLAKSNSSSSRSVPFSLLVFAWQNFITLAYTVVCSPVTVLVSPRATLFAIFVYPISAFFSFLLFLDENEQD